MSSRDKNHKEMQQNGYYNSPKPKPVSCTLYVKKHDRSVGGIQENKHRKKVKAARFVKMFSTLIQR